MLGACVLVQVDQKASGNEASMPLPDPTQEMSLHLDMAIEALRHLDSDNRMVARCQDYLEQFVQVVQALGKHRPPTHFSRVHPANSPIAIAQGLIPQPNDWQAPYAQNHQAYSQMQHEGDYALLQNTAVGMFNNGMISSTKQSPLGMELGEFMLDGDLEFLSSHSYAYNRGVPQ